MREQKHNNQRYYAALGEYLRALREQASLTQRDVSVALGYSTPQFISNFECGRASPPLQKLKTMIDLYGGSTQRLVKLIIEAERLYLRDALQDVARSGSRMSKPPLN